MEISIKSIEAFPKKCLYTIKGMIGLTPSWPFRSRKCIFFLSISVLIMLVILLERCNKAVAVSIQMLHPLNRELSRPLG